MEDALRKMLVALTALLLAHGGMACQQQREDSAAPKSSPMTEEAPEREKAAEEEAAGAEERASPEEEATEGEEPTEEETAGAEDLEESATDEPAPTPSASEEPSPSRSRRARSPGSSGGTVAGCPDGRCSEACASYEGEQRTACVQAYEAGCFAETKPADYDCGVFGASGGERESDSDLEDKASPNFEEKSDSRRKKRRKKRSIQPEPDLEDKASPNFE
jgi:hypothetical protein